MGRVGPSPVIPFDNSKFYVLWLLQVYSPLVSISAMMKRVDGQVWVVSGVAVTWEEE